MVKVPPRHSLRIKNGISSSLPIYFPHLESDFVHEKSLKNHPHNIKTINFSLPHGLCIFSWRSVEIKKEEMEYFKLQIKYNKKSNKLKQKAMFKTMKACVEQIENHCYQMNVKFIQEPVACPLSICVTIKQTSSHGSHCLGSQ